MADPERAAAPSGAGGGFKISLCLFLLALVAGSILAFTNLDANVLWDDEAATALLARNLFETGRRTAWDGTNLVGYDEGRQLNENLVYIYAPPQELYIAAAGIKVLGDSVFGARAPFAAIGILGIAVVGLWGGLLAGRRFPWWLPSMLLALSPAYLLYIRNCRYYAAAMFWVILFWAAWTAMGAVHGGRERRRFVFLGAVAVLAATGLCTSHYVQAAVAFGVLPVFFLERRFRRCRHFVTFGVLGAVFGGFMLWVIVNANPLQQSAGSIYAKILTKAWTVTWLQVRDMGYFEFFAWPMLLPLALPRLVPRLAPERDIARTGGILAVMMIAGIFIIAIIGPQNTASLEDSKVVASMQYSIAMIPLGVVISAIGLVLLWKWNRWAGLGVGAILVFTNFLYLGTSRDQPRHYEGKRFVRSTLVDYAGQIAHPVMSVYDGMVQIAKELPPGTEIRVFPHYMAYPAMYAARDLHYSDQLARDVSVRPELLQKLPPYVFADHIPEVCLLYGRNEASGVEGRPGRFVVHDAPDDLGDFLARYRFEKTAVVPAAWPVGARPDIPLRWFEMPNPDGEPLGAFILCVRNLQP